MEFEQLSVSTQTFIVKSNIAYIDLKQLYDNFCLIDNAIPSIKYKLEHKGEFNNKPIKPKAKNFLNCITLSISLDKNLNVKIFNNGVFQYTGCKHHGHVVKSMTMILTQMSRIGGYELNHKLAIETNPDSIVYYIVSAMRNVDFELGFKIDRQLFGTLIGKTTEYYIPPMTSGYMGVKIKIPIKDTSDIRIPRVDFCCVNCCSVESTIRHDDFYSNVFPFRRKLRTYFVSISVFQNGKVLMSGLDETVQKPCYEWFIATVDKMRDEINLDKPLKTFSRALVLRGTNSNGRLPIGVRY